MVAAALSWSFGELSQSTSIWNTKFIFFTFLLLYLGLMSFNLDVKKNTCFKIVVTET